MKDTFKRQLWLSIGIVAGSIVVASVAFYVLSVSLSDEASKIVLDRATIDTQTSALGSLASLKSDAPQAARYELAMRSLLPDQYKIVGFGQWLSAIGAKHAVLTSFSLQGAITPAGKGVAGTAGFSMNAEGSHDAIIAFLKDLESEAQGFLLSLDTFDIAKSGDHERITARGVLFFQ